MIRSTFFDFTGLKKYQDLFHLEIKNILMIEDMWIAF